MHSSIRMIGSPPIKKTGKVDIDMRNHSCRVSTSIIQQGHHNLWAWEKRWIGWSGKLTISLGLQVSNLMKVFKLIIHNNQVITIMLINSYLWKLLKIRSKIKLIISSKGHLRASKFKPINTGLRALKVIIINLNKSPRSPSLSGLQETMGEKWAFLCTEEQELAAQEALETKEKTMEWT